MPSVMTRRDALRTAGLGLGGLALSALLRDEARAETHFLAKAKSVILLFQSGGPGQMDLFDRKPELQKRDGQKSPIAIDKFLPGNSDQLVACPFPFQRRGRCGMELSTLLPHIGALADELCLVRSMHT